MKKKDIVIIVVLLLISGIGYLVYNYLAPKGDMIEVYYHNKVIDVVSVDVNKTYTYEGDYGSFSLEVKDGQYHATNVECPNHDCEKVGWVKKGSSTQIVCLPNEIYVIQAGVEDSLE